MLRRLFAAAVVALGSLAVAQTPVPTPAPVVIYTSEPVVYSQPVIYSRPVVVQPARPQPAVGLGAVNSPFYFYPELTIGGPGYMYRSTPPHNGWSSGYRGAHYGEPVPGAAARRGPWSR